MLKQQTPSTCTCTWLLNLLATATDNHVGYMEKDPVRFNDSLESFEEILKVAKDQEVLNLATACVLRPASLT